MILPLNIFNFIESALSVLGVILVVIVVICVIGFIGFLCYVKSRDEKAEREKLSRENAIEYAIRNSEIYKKIFAYICSVVNENLREIPNQCNTQIPSQWLNCTVINFEEYKMTVCDVNRSDVAVRNLKKNYCDFGYETLKIYCDYISAEVRIGDICDVLEKDLEKHYPALMINSLLTIDSHGIINIDYRRECAKHSPYK